MQPANLLNDLSTRQWLVSTKSVWYRDIADLAHPAMDEIANAVRAQYGDERAEALLGQVLGSLMASRPPVRDVLKATHPATFAESDIVRFISFFTKRGEKVLDPFLGSGSTLVAAQSCGREGVGIELSPEWATVAKKRVKMASAQLTMLSDASVQLTQRVIQGDARSELQKIEADSIDFIVTSPPYWGVLNKPADHKVRRERLAKGLPTRYSQASDDLANIPSYDDFLGELRVVFDQFWRVLRGRRYCVVIVSDFRDGSRFHLFHADVARALEAARFDIGGLTILVQDSKTLYPYGMPYAFVSNIHHQVAVIARKPSRD